VHGCTVDARSARAEELPGHLYEWMASVHAPDAYTAWRSSNRGEGAGASESKLSDDSDAAGGGTRTDSDLDTERK